MAQTHELMNGWKLTTEKITIHKLGEVEFAIEYQVFQPDGTAIESVSEMDEIMPDEVDDVFDAILKAITKSETPTNKLRINSYMIGAFSSMIKKGTTYRTEAGWTRHES